MTDHLYTPAGIRGGEGSSRYKGSDAAVVELLERAIEKGASLDFDHGTVTYSESGRCEIASFILKFHKPTCPFHASSRVCRRQWVRISTPVV